MLLLMPLACFAQKTSEELLKDTLKKYAIKSGRITYVVEGGAEGSEEIIFEDHGWKSVRKQIALVELYGITQKQVIHEITNGDFIHRLNYGDSTIRQRIDMKWSQTAYFNSREELSSAILFSLGGTQQTDSIVNKKNCQVWTFEHRNLMELWIWNGLVMKRKVKLGDALTVTTMDSMDLETPVDPIVFQIPSFFKQD